MNKTVFRLRISASALSRRAAAHVTQTKIQCALTSQRLRVSHDPGVNPVALQKQEGKALRSGAVAFIRTRSF